MKLRLVFAIAALWASESAAQNWVLVAETDDTKFYAIEVVKKLPGNQTRYWVLYDYKTPRRGLHGDHLSTLGHHVGDCSDEKSRTLSFTDYSGNMNKGSPIPKPANTITDPEWVYFVPGSPGDKLLKFACSRKPA